MSEERKRNNRVTAHYATAADYPRMSNYQVGGGNSIGSLTMQVFGDHAYRENGGRSRNRTNDTRIFNTLSVGNPYVSLRFRYPFSVCHRNCHSRCLVKNRSHPHNLCDTL